MNYYKQKEQICCRAAKPKNPYAR